MSIESKIGPWFARFVLFAAGLLLTIISIRYLFSPVSATGAFKITLGTSTAITNIRIGFGAFPLAFAIFTFSCLFSSKRILTGLYFFGIVIGVVTIVRILGAVIDGASAETLKVLRPEIVFCILTVAAILLEYRRRYRPGVDPGN